MSTSYTDQEVINLIGQVLTRSNLDPAHFLFNRTKDGLEVITIENDESWVLVSLLGWLQADFDLIFIDDTGKPANFTDHQALKFRIHSVDEDAINLLIPKEK